MDKDEEIYLCHPTYCDSDRQSARQFWVRGLQPNGPHSGIKTIYDDTGHSLLANAFNYHWANALNLQLAGRNITRFCMLHSDIVPEDWWSDKLLLELEATNADMVSVVVPIKDARGLTSVAIDDPNDEWSVYRRLTMTEIMRLPETFSAQDCEKVGYCPKDVWRSVDKLLVNSGCWVCRFDRPWRNVKQCGRGPNEKYCGESCNCQLAVYFTIKDKIQLGKDGRYETVVMPEDWQFSRCLNKLGCKILATRKVNLTHKGALYYPNDRVWGDYKVDEDLRYKWSKNNDREAQGTDRGAVEDKSLATTAL